MTLHQLKCFCVLAEVLHYTDAAKQLYISQPSLSYSISELQKELGAPLFQKRGQKITLTKYGKAFLPYAQKSILAVDRGIHCVQDMLQPISSINLGYIYSSSIYLASMIKGFRESCSADEVAINFFQGVDNQIVSKLRNGQLDVGLSTFPGDDVISGEPIYDQELYLVVPNNHALASRSEASLAELKGEKFVSLTADSSLRKLLDETFEHISFQPDIAFEAEECNAMASFVGAQFGFTVMPEIPALSSYAVSLLRISDLPLSRTIYLLWPSNHQLSGTVEQFKRYVIDRAEYQNKMFG